MKVDPITLNTCTNCSWIAATSLNKSTDEWIPIDWCYYPDLRPMDNRPKLKNNEKYIDDYFMFEIGKVIITPDTNRVRSPEIYNNNGTIKPNIFSGIWLNTHV